MAAQPAEGFTNLPPAKEKLPPFQSKLFQRREIDEIDEFDQNWAPAFEKLQQLLASSSEREFQNMLMDKVSQNMEFHNEITMGLLYGILTTEDEKSASTFCQLLHFIVRDNFALLVSLLKTLIFDKLQKCHDSVRTQIVWLVDKLIAWNVAEVDSLIMFLMRHISGGDILQRNVSLINLILGLLNSHREWLLGNALLIPIVVFTFLRLIPDHTRQPFEQIRDKEIGLTVHLLRNKWSECVAIGRDLIRVLQDVARLPEFREIWRDLLTKPQALAANFGGINQLLAIRTPRIYIQSRVTPEMETQLMFLMKNVKMGMQKRYQQWFANKFLATPESESLIPDIIRFICCCYHPPNHVLCSDIIPRWAVIGWLLKCVRTPYMAANAKLALFYDWLFFDKTDNIMNIEPGMLLMFHSIPKYANITATLLEFLVLVVDDFLGERKDITLQGVTNSFRIMLSKGVVATLAPLFTCPTLDPKIQKRLNQIFQPFIKELEDKGEMKKEDGLTSKPVTTPQTLQMLGRTPSQEDTSPPMSPVSSPTPTEAPTPHTLDLHSLPFEEEADEPEDIPAGVTKPEIEPVGSPYEELIESEHADMDTDSSVPLASVIIPPSLSDFTNSINDFIQKPSQQNLTTILNQFMEHHNAASLANDVAATLVQAVSTEFSDDISDADLFNSSAPWKYNHHVIFNYFHHVVEKNKQQAKSDLMVQLITSMVLVENSVGFRLLCFLIGKSGAGKTLAESEETLDDTFTFSDFVKKQDIQLNASALYPYELYCDSYVEVVTQKGLAEDITESKHVVARDMKKLNEWRMNVFYSIIPTVYKLLPHLTINNTGLIYNIIASIDSTQLHSLICSLTLGEISVFGKNPHALLVQSLQWETFEQICMWQLLTAEFSSNVQKKKYFENVVIQLLKQIDPSLHQEALNGMVIILKDLIPSPLLLEALGTLPMTFYKFVICVLSNWHNSLQSKLQTKNIIQVLADFAAKGQKDNAIQFLKVLWIWNKKQRTLPLWAPLPAQPPTSSPASQQLTLFDSIQKTIQSFGIQSQFAGFLVTQQDKTPNNNSSSEDLSFEEDDDPSKQKRKRLRKITD